MLVSIIIITLNEAENIENTIKSARLSAYFPSGKQAPIEIIVSDGGSTDDTLDIAQMIADKVVRGPKGRYLQLNNGAKKSRGDILLFLHADTVLPKSAIIQILYRLKDPKIIGGAFKKYWNWNPAVKRSSFLKFASFLWLKYDNWMVGLLRSFPGDNAIFVRKSIFKEINGFRPLWICEDLDFSNRLKKYGKKRSIYIDSVVLTSARRFEKYGFFNVIFIWLRIFWFWRLGMSPKHLRAKFKNYKEFPERGNKPYLRF
ncbi:MAG: TIGR04283 family arsenosugar biosynthesis glycosyltransferase [Promethearchaeota archaeon]|jgi:glycosyltransferase involved in cell wall biosynthesis